MHNQEELKYECPCYKCLTLGVCKGKELQVLMKDCSLLYDYLYKECASTPKNYISMDIVNLHTFCNIMSIKIKKNHEEPGYFIKYWWQNESKT